MDFGSPNQKGNFVRDQSAPKMPSSMSDVPSQSVKKNMPRNQIDNKSELDVVSQRVERTKKEIAQLNAQLEKLISDGIKTSTATMDTLTVCHKEKTDSAINSKSEQVCPTVKSHLLRAHDYSIPLLRQDAVVATKETKNEETTKKVRHYDREAAREYMKKQREKRKELLLLKRKESKSNEDLKKQKLKQLQQKSLQIVSKHNRKASKKSSAITFSSSTQSVKDCLKSIRQDNDVDTNLLERVTANVGIDDVNQILRQKEISANVQIRKPLQNVTIRHSDMNDLSTIPELCSPQPSLKDHHQFIRFNKTDEKAAIKIQAIVKGYLQRKRYKRALELRKRLDRKNTEPTPPTRDVDSKLTKEATPLWLQTPTALPYPYNFLSVVKQKLCLAALNAANINITSSNLAVQTSLLQEENDYGKSDTQKTIGKEDCSLKSFLSQKCIDLDVNIKPLKISDTLDNIDEGKLQKSVHNGKSRKSNDKMSCDSGSDTSKNIPELSSEITSSAALSKKKSEIEYSTDTDFCVSDDIKNLKLRKTSDTVHNQRVNSKETLERNPNAPVSSIHNSSRDSIIAYNKCNYSHTSSKSEEQISQSNNANCSELNTKNIPKEKKYRSSEYDFPKKIPNRSISEKPLCKCDTLDSFHDYMQNYDVIVPVTENVNIESISQDRKSETISSKYEKEVSKSINSHLLPIKLPADIETSTKINDYSNEFLSLKRPNIGLHDPIQIKVGKRSTIRSNITTNEIQLKFEAELHLINDFNDSLKQAMAVEKSLIDLKTNNFNKRTIVCHQDTQTSQKRVESRSSNESKMYPFINYNRGTDMDKNDKSDYHSIDELSNAIKVFDEIDENLSSCKDRTIETVASISDSRKSESNFSGLIPTGLELSELQDTTNSRDPSFIETPSSNKRNYSMQAFLSLEMFEQLIKDEDARIDNLKAILKIREKALVDRTKGELAWLEIQKKYLRDSGKLKEISTIKKKQRGLLIKLEHERHEMQRLKQMQKVVSKERKSALREQRNMIKAQLSTANTDTKIKRNSREEKRRSGPFKAYSIKSHRESVKSEASCSRQSSLPDEIINVISHSQSIVSEYTDGFGSKIEKFNNQNLEIKTDNCLVKTESVKRTLLMRERALQKRRKTAEELLQWHQRLLEEEGKVTELELAASAIVNQNVDVQNSNESEEKYKLKGRHLNSLWQNITRNEQKKFNDDRTYFMCKSSLEKFCKTAKEMSSGNSDRLNFDHERSNCNENGSEKLHSDRSITNSSFSSESTANTLKTNALPTSKEDSTTNSYQSDFEMDNSDRKTQLSTNTNIVDTVPFNGENVTFDDKKNRPENNELLFEKTPINNTLIKEINELNDSLTLNHESDESPDGKQQKSKNGSNESMEQNRLQVISNTNGAFSKTDSSIVEISNDSAQSTVIGSASENCKTSNISTREQDSQRELNFENDSFSSEIKSATNKSSEEVKFKSKSDDIFDINLIQVPRLSNKSEDNETETACKELSSKTSNGTDFTNMGPVETEIESHNNDSKNCLDIQNGHIQSDDLHSCLENEIIERENPPKSTHNDEEQVSNSSTSEDVSSHILEEEINKISVRLNGNELKETESFDREESKDEYSILFEEIAQEETSNISSSNQHSCMHLALENKVPESVEEDTINDHTEVSVGNVTKDSTTRTEESVIKVDETCNHSTEQPENAIKEEKKIGLVNNNIDVKKRVSEILADANLERENKSPRVQDMYITAYDIFSPQHSTDSSLDDSDKTTSSELHKCANDEVEELLKKQMEIELEIKQLEQQQKEQLSYLFLREIPNKPPPPYTPPTSAVGANNVNLTVLPTTEEEVAAIVSSISHLLHGAYLNRNLDTVALKNEERSFIQCKCNVENDCIDFMFDLSKEVALEHYKQFDKETGPSWTRTKRSTKLALGDPFSEDELCMHIVRTMIQWLNSEKTEPKETNKWSGKKRDHVDEVLVLVSQAEENEWINYNKDEVFVKNELADDITNMLLSEVAQILHDIFTKKTM